MTIINRVNRNRNYHKNAVSKPLKLYYCDLYLTIACGCNHEKAWECLVNRYMDYLVKCFQRLIPDRSTVHDLTCNLIGDLYLSNISGDKLILSYEGRCKLKYWLKSIAINRAINEKQLKWNSIIFTDSELLIADNTSMQEIQFNLLNDEYQQLIHECFHIIRNSLNSDDRLILFMRYNKMISLGEIAKFYNVHQSTITRRIKNIQKRLNKVINSHFSNRHDVDSYTIMKTMIYLLDYSDQSIFDYI